MIYFLFSLALSFAQTAEPTTCEHDESTFRCVKYIRNYDSDTITVEIPGVHPYLGHKAGVRVKGIDTPEIKTKDQCEKSVGRMAQRLTENLLKNARRIDLANIEKEKYGRILADVIYDGQNLKDILLKNGVALEYDGGTKAKTNWCKRFPAAAGAAGIKK